MGIMSWPHLRQTQICTARKHADHQSINFLNQLLLHDFLPVRKAAFGTIIRRVQRQIVRHSKRHRFFRLSARHKGEQSIV